MGVHNLYLLLLISQQVKTHDSESRGQEEAGRTRLASELLHVAPL